MHFQLRLLILIDQNQAVYHRITLPSPVGIQQENTLLSMYRKVVLDSVLQKTKYNRLWGHICI